MAVAQVMIPCGFGGILAIDGRVPEPLVSRAGQDDHDF
jgi:hypothetical protein